MPELPEVETVAKGLKRMFGSQKIIDVRCHRQNLRYLLDEEKLQKICCGKKIKEIQRRGKYMIWEINDKNFILVHLGMSGSFCKVNTSAPLKKHQHVQFILQNNTEIRYEDPRRFGFILGEINNSWSSHKLLANLGLEPWDKNNQQLLWEKAKNRSTTIKQFIMDQTIIVGVGNIYASEALFLAKMNPFLPVQKISKKKWQTLLNKICFVLEQAIEKGGTTLSARGFSDADGNHGKFAIELKVYGRAKEPCYDCESLITESKISGRSTYFCPCCQA